MSSDEDSRTVVIRSAGGKELSIEEDVSPESEEKTGTKIINLYVILTAVAGGCHRPRQAGDWILINRG